jgi:hypothetical protein
MVQAKQKMHHELIVDDSARERMEGKTGRGLRMLVEIEKLPLLPGGGASGCFMTTRNLLKKRQILERFTHHSRHPLLPVKNFLVDFVEVERRRSLEAPLENHECQCSAALPLDSVAHAALNDQINSCTICNMPTELPYAADAEVSLSYDELEVRKSPSSRCNVLTSFQVLRIQHEKELAQAHVTVQTKFNYAWGLVKSPMREHQVEGVRLLQGERIG